MIFSEQQIRNLILGLVTVNPGVSEAEIESFIERMEGEYINAQMVLLAVDGELHMGLGADGELIANPLTSRE